MEVIYEGHLEDGRFEIRKQDEGGYTLHIWSWWTPERERTKKWGEEGEVEPLSPDEVDTIINRYRAGKIRVINQLLKHREPPYAVSEGTIITGYILRFEFDGPYEVRLIKKEGCYYVQLIHKYPSGGTEVWDYSVLFKSGSLKEADEEYRKAVKKYIGVEVPEYWALRRKDL